MLYFPFHPMLDRAMPIRSLAFTAALFLSSPALAADAPATPSAMVAQAPARSEEHTSELQSLMRISYAVFCLKKKKTLNISLTRHTPLHNKHLRHSQTHFNIV